MATQADFDRLGNWALMFNDELSLGECTQLVAKLANCVFPFMCAHGRPSMVPLVGLGERDGGETASGELLGSFTAAGGGEGQESFVQAWKSWKEKG